jgi:hypothetical protein
MTKDYFMKFLEVNKHLSESVLHLKWLIEEINMSDRKDRISAKVTIEQAEAHIQEVEAIFASQSAEYQKWKQGEAA